MALRLSEPSAPSAPRSSPATTTPAVDLPARASALLAARDLAGYRALFAQAAEEPDVHQRYALRMHLLEAGLSVPRASVHDTAGAFLVVAECALALLEEEPREPRILNLAGVALYELGALAGARRLFEAARRLEPELPHVRRNLREVARRRRTGNAIAKLPAAVVGALRPLEARAKRVVGAARPVEGLTLSLCMIVRDEETMIGRCLEAVHEAVDEIVVVDTGSQDATMEIARSYGATVIEREWTGSFADARNVSFDAATSDWILYLDADEVLCEGEGPKLRALTTRTWREAYYITETNHTGDLEDGTAVNHTTLRVFRNRPEYRFEGRIHEQIAHRLPGFLPERFESTGVRIEHFGYLGVVREAKDKSTRNLELLERQAADGNDTPFLHFNLGSERSARGEHEQALEHFRRAWETVREEPVAYGFSPSLVARLGLALRNLGRREEFERHVDEGLRVFPGFTDLVMERALVARQHGEREHARELLERCLQMGDSPDRYCATVGSGTYIPLCVLAEMHIEAGELDAAEDLLRRSLADHPRFLGAVEPLAQVLLARGGEPAEVVRTLREAVEEDSPSLRFLLAVPLYEAGAVEEAEVQLRAVLARQPHAAAAQLALAESLLSQRRYAEAAEAVAALPAESPIAASGVRTELFARLVGGEDDVEVAGALERAREAGAPAEELVVFEAWRALTGGGAAPSHLPAEAAVVLLPALEALLRVGEDEHFVALVGLVDALAIARRQRRQLLAEMYLRRGLVDFAADTWAAVCQEDGPDAGALAGLAAVAVVRGDDQDARLFAETAQELEPGHAGAARVLARVGG